MGSEPGLPKIPGLGEFHLLLDHQHRSGQDAQQPNSCVCFLALNPEWKCHEDNHHGDISAAPYRAMREMFFFFKSLLKME